MPAKNELASTVEAFEALCSAPKPPFHRIDPPLLLGVTVPPIPPPKKLLLLISSLLSVLVVDKANEQEADTCLGRRYGPEER